LTSLRRADQPRIFCTPLSVGLAAITFATGRPDGEAWMASVLEAALTPHPVVVKKGERLRLDVGSRTDLLRSDASHGHAQFDMHVPPYFSRNTLHHGPETYIELHKVPAS